MNTNDYITTSNTFSYVNSTSVSGQLNIIHLNNVLNNVSHLDYNEHIPAQPATYSIEIPTEIPTEIPDIPSINITTDTSPDTRCMARIKSNLNHRCSRKIKKNCDFCGVHLRAKHVIRFNEDIPKDYCPKIKKAKKEIGLENVPMKIICYYDLKQHNFNSKKFTYRHILYSLEKYNLPNLKNKQKNFVSLQQYVTGTYNKNKMYSENIAQIILISKIYRGYCMRNINKARGPGFLKRSLINNTHDFLHFTDIKNISNQYLITYKDESGFIYGFDIQSLLCYIEELDTIHINNPYTRKKFPKKFIDNLYILHNYNKKKTAITTTKQNIIAITNEPIHNEPIHNEPINNKQLNKPIKCTPELKVKRLCVSIFQRMDEIELYTQASWFLDLNIAKLKKLYFLIEDIWNYRARLTPLIKKKFVTNGVAFNWPITYIKKITNKIKIQNILLKEFEKFVYQGATKTDCITASYWILMGLTSVSPSAAAGCPALVQSNY